MLHTVDMFKETLPAFNIEGNRYVSTNGGGIISVTIMYIIFLFAVLKMQQLLSRHNPTVNTFVERDVFDDTMVWHGEDNPDF